MNHLFIIFMVLTTKKLVFTKCPKYKMREKKFNLQYIGFWRPKIMYNRTGKSWFIRNNTIVSALKKQFRLNLMRFLLQVRNCFQLPMLLFDCDATFFSSPFESLFNLNFVEPLLIPPDHSENELIVLLQHGIFGLAIKTRMKKWEEN